MEEKQSNIIIYNTDDGKARVTLYAVDGTVWMNQKQMVELFATSKHNSVQYIYTTLKSSELYKYSVIK